MTVGRFYPTKREAGLPGQGHPVMSEKGKESKSQYGIVNFERRRSPRFSVDLPIEYSRVDSSRKNNGHTGNASGGGLMLFLGEPMEVGAGLRIKVFFSSEPKLDSIEVQAQVVWTEIPFGKEKDHRCGVRFTDIASEDLTKLKNFLDGLSTIRPPFRIPSSSQQDFKP
ncbi:MAG TPA: PilZ domain-containing protein [Thermodesulfobacteriota bacterium]|nr:PilZ domain-containing protein [Thermodesulfobacteriota bacterium]